ncbi:MAG: CSLREA domain-containing protein [Anaerolineales bacterium]
MRISIRKITTLLAFILFAAAVWAAPAQAGIVKLLVNKAEDHDDGACTNSDCTLREAIRAANGDGQDNLIAFDLPAPHRITISTLLPVLTEDGTVIDGTTDPDYHAEPVVVLAGDLSVPVPIGLEIRAGRCAVRGLSLIHFVNPIDYVTGAVYITGGEGNLVEKNHIGIAPIPVKEKNSIGVHLASNNATVRDNVISNNGFGIRVDEGLTRHIIQGNRIGTDPSGKTAVPNISGIWLEDDTYEILIGGAGAGNLISGNIGGGISASGHGHFIRSNLIGTDITGSAALPNGFGIDIAGPGGGFQIGGSGAGDGNVISGNSDFGIYIGGGSHTIQGNKIGTDKDGTRALGNLDGLILSSYFDPAMAIQYESHDVQVGGVLGSGAENVISGNRSQGISILTSHHVIQGNLIGTNAAGTAAIPNDWEGIGVSGGGHENLIGGAEAGRGNIISGNYEGVVLYSDNNRVLGNRIGTQRGGEAALGNETGVLIFGNGNFVGDGTPDAGNIISGNGVGVAVEEGNGNRVLGNRIGTDASGVIAIPNSVGITIGFAYDADPTGTIVGVGAGNWIEWNRQCGILVSEGVHNAEIAGNKIDNNGGLSGGMCGGQGILIAGTSLEVAGITLRKNSIFRNDGLGIEITGSMANGSIDPPVLTGGNATLAEGTTCPGCRVEVFLADVDPTGSGEGKTFLKDGIAGADGSFSVPLAGVGLCGVITATATDAVGNTSEFSKNFGAGFCFWLPPILWLITIPFWILFGTAAVVFLARHRGRGRIPLTVMGGLLGAGLGVLTLALPFVRMTAPRSSVESAGEYVPPSPCSQYMDVSRTSPPDGTVFNAGIDVRITIYSDSPDSNSPIRWRLGVDGPAGTSAEREFTGEVNILLSELGFDPATPGTYAWTLSGERSDGASNKWVSICADRRGRIFTLRRSQTDTLQIRNPAWEEPSPAADPGVLNLQPTATMRNDANCRAGPGTDYRIVTMLSRDKSYPIDGRNYDGSWWWIRLPNNLGHCWVGSQNVVPAGNIGNLQIIEAPPLGCWVYAPRSPTAWSDRTICAVPCPDGAKPGGVCEP